MDWGYIKQINPDSEVYRFESPVDSSMWDLISEHVTGQKLPDSGMIDVTITATSDDDVYGAVGEMDNRANAEMLCEVYLPGGERLPGLYAVTGVVVDGKLWGVELKRVDQEEE